MDEKWYSRWHRRSFAVKAELEEQDRQRSVSREVADPKTQRWLVAQLEAVLEAVVLR